MATALADERASEPEVIWRPHSGTSQELFLTCPVYECLYTGTRGPGKTDALVMDFAQHVGQGFGEDWRGILFRQSFPQLRDVIAKSRKWFRRIFPEGSPHEARYNKADHVWTWADGEELILSYMDDPADYWNYHGHEYPWIGWEEITNWPSLECYHVMKACNRSSSPDVPRKYRSTCNPYGPGHNAVKAYFIDPAPAGVPFTPEAAYLDEVLQEVGVDLEQETLRCVTIHGHYSENRTLMEAQPNYPEFIARAAANPEQAKAWLADDWDIVAGGMFDDVWSRRDHVLPNFSVPRTWRLYRAFDWGSTKPFSVGWWAEANGEDATLPDGRKFCPPRGSRIRMAEWYGWDGKTPNVGLRMTDADIGKGIVRRERDWGVHRFVQPGPADSSIFSADPGHRSPAEAMAAAGATFVPADKSAGSRKRGWEAMRRMLKEARKDRPEEPGLWVMGRCLQFIRTIPTLPRCEKDPDDVDTESEDHIGDETRYALDARGPKEVRSEAISI